MAKRDLSEMPLPEPGTSAPELPPHPVYNRVGDLVMYAWRQEPAYMERVGPFLTLYRSRTSGEPVGLAIKSVRKILLALLDSLAEPLDAGDARRIWRIRDIIVNLLSRHDIPKEHREAYLMLLRNEIDEYLDELIPEEALQPAI